MKIAKRTTINKITMTFAFIVFAHHLICTVLLTLPKNPATNLYGAYINKYSEALFRQNWKLFAPMPAVSNTQLHIKCIRAGENQNNIWHNVQSTVLQKHYNNRFTYRGKFLHYLAHVPRELVRSSHGFLKGQSFNDKIIKTRAYQDAKLFSAEYCKSLNSNELQAVQFMVVVQEVASFSKVFGAKREARVNDSKVNGYKIEFPTIEVQHGIAQL